MRVEKVLTLALLSCLALCGKLRGEERMRGLHHLPYGDAGCGWGSQVMGKDDQILAATTNGSFGNQTFAMSSGTSNCVNYENEEVVGEFIDFHRPRLQSEMARGQGEVLATLEHLMGCPGGSLAGIPLSSAETLSSAEFRTLLLEEIRLKLGSQCSYF